MPNIRAQQRQRFGAIRHGELSDGFGFSPRNYMADAWLRPSQFNKRQDGPSYEVCADGAEWHTCKPPLPFPSLPSPIIHLLIPDDQTLNLLQASISVAPTDAAKTPNIVSFPTALLQKSVVVPQATSVQSEMTVQRCNMLVYRLLL